jgi:tetratricopeptide (TPR) repeat protein
VPLDWAVTQNNPGSALRTLGERESGTARLEEAVAAYRDALKKYTRERVPLQWATIQNNLGNALWTLGERESGTARLEEAVAAYRDALMERIRERVPLDWAVSFGNQGVALMQLAERTHDAAMAETAVQQIETAPLGPQIRCRGIRDLAAVRIRSAPVRGFELRCDEPDKLLPPRHDRAPAGNEQSSMMQKIILLGR